jgi:hypothetical protein
MSRAYGICGRRRGHTGFWWGNLKGRTHLEGLVVDWKTILKMMNEHGLEHLAEDRNKWWAFVNAVVNVWVPENTGGFLE